jgi:MSHA pilin protein MshD
MRGLSLIELIMFIVIVGAALAGIITIISKTTESSADPMIRKQALAIAEAMLEEVRLQPFTVCDADDTGGATVAIGTIASASTGGGSATLDVTGVNLTGQNAVVVFIGYSNDGDETVTSVVIDPGGANVNVPYVADRNNTQSGGDDARIYIFGLSSPPQGTFTIRVTFNNAINSGTGAHVVAYPLSGVNTSTPFGTPGTAQNDGQGAVTVPSASGELVLAGMAAEYKGTSTVASPAVEDRDLVINSDHSLATAHRDGAGPNVTFNWSGGGSGDHWAAAGVSVKPGCAENIGPETGESRYSSTNPFDHVNDYDGFDSNTAVPTGIRTLDGTLIPGLDGYRVTVSITGQALGGIGNDAAGKPQSLLISVTVTGPGNTSVTLHGYRTRYAPKETP